jgi:hypothetical protein
VSSFKIVSTDVLLLISFNSKEDEAADNSNKIDVVSEFLAVLSTDEYKADSM